MADPIEITTELTASMAPKRTETGHKGTFGTALICAGSDYMSGALDIASGAALRSGCGMVIACSTDLGLSSVRVNHPCCILARREDTVAGALRQAEDLLKRSSAVLIGPGLDTGDKVSFAFLEYFIVNAPSLVIDASAITMLSRHKEELYPLIRSRKTPVLLTPHVGEFTRLTGTTYPDAEDMEEACVQFALQNKCIAVLKNHKTIIAVDNGKKYISSCENSGLAKGGSGDFLAGLMCGLLAQGMTGEQAAVCAVKIHSLAGMISAYENGKRAMLPTDLEMYLTEAFEEAGWS